MSFLNSSLPFSVKVKGRTDTSHPVVLLSTLTPKARPMIWWPKQIPIRRTRSWARTFLVKLTSLRIQGLSSNELCSACGEQ